MARGKGKRTSTLALVGWAVLMLALGLGAGLMLGQQGCGKREAPAKRGTPTPEPKNPEPKKPEKKQAKPTAEAAKPQRQEPASPLPRLALVIDDLGYIQPELVTRLCSLPVPFSVAVLPYQEHTRESAEIPQRLGKEVMLYLPMEPIGYPGPGHDPGPNAILYNLPEPEVRRRVRLALDRKS